MTGAVSRGIRGLRPRWRTVVRGGGASWSEVGGHRGAEWRTAGGAEWGEPRCRADGRQGRLGQGVHHDWITASLAMGW